MNSLFEVFGLRGISRAEVDVNALFNQIQGAMTSVAPEIQILPHLIKKKHILLKPREIFGQQLVVSRLEPRIRQPLPSVGVWTSWVTERLVSWHVSPWWSGGRPTSFTSRGRLQFLKVLVWAVISESVVRPSADSMDQNKSFTKRDHGTDLIWIPLTKQTRTAFFL